MKISIVTATFNSGKTIGDTLESVLNQTYDDYELIIKDVGSVDSTLDICRSYEPKFKGKLRILVAPDMCVYDGMNQGIAAATGDIVGILNSDDFYTSNDVLKVVASEFAQYPDTEAVYGDVHYVSPHDTNKLVRYYSSARFRPSWMRMGFMPAHPSFYCKRSVYERYKLDASKISGFKGDKSCAYYNTTYKIAADFEILLRMIYCGKIKMRYIGKDFVTMRTGGLSSRGASSHRQINADHLRAFKENGIKSNIALLSLRYAYKVGELIVSKIKH